MNTVIPSVEDVRRRLELLKDGGINEVARLSGVPVSTLWKIRCGATPNPGFETVRKFLPFLVATPTPTPAAQATKQGVANA
jgi:transcriptional regulator with XRE-family HTH domain